MRVRAADLRRPCCVTKHSKVERPTSLGRTTDSVTEGGSGVLARPRRVAPAGRRPEVIPGFRGNSGRPELLRSPAAREDCPRPWNPSAFINPRDPMFDDDEDLIRFLFGPCDGGEIEADLFGGCLPDSLAISSKVRVAFYDLDIDAAGPCYRFVGWDSGSDAATGTRRGQSDR